MEIENFTAVIAKAMRAFAEPAKAAMATLTQFGQVVLPFSMTQYALMGYPNGKSKRGYKKWLNKQFIAFREPVQPCKSAPSVV